MVINSNDKTIADPQVKINNENSQYNISFDMSSIEVIHNCKDKEASAKISMTVTSNNCNPYTIYWEKQCKLKSSIN